LFPTLAGLAGADTTKGKPLDGMDMWPTLSEGAASPRSEIVYNVEMYRGAVREDDWKLVWNAPLPSRIELFDIASDPSETENLAARHPEIVARLRDRIEMLAGEMARSQFFAATMDAYMDRHGGPPAFPPPRAPLPNEPGFYATID
jgi:arylsulfatase A-like enzyme